MMGALFCALARLISGGSVRWIGCSPEDKKRIYFANHTSHLDFVIIWSSLPKTIRQKTRPIAAKDYWDHGTIRKYIAHKIIRAVLINRKDIMAREEGEHPIEKMTEALDEGASLIIFPEGSRNTQETMKPFKSGLYHLSKKRPGVELVPVYLENFNRILPKGEFLMVPILGSVTFGPSIKLQDGETRAAFLQRASHSIEELKNK